MINNKALYYGKKILFLTILTIVFLANPRCKKDCTGDVLTDIKFSPSEIAVVPYTGGHKYIFKDSINDSICFFSHNPKHFTGNVSETLPAYPGEDIEGCLGDTRSAEYISWGLWTSNSQDTSIVIYIKYYHPFGEDEKYKDIYIELTYDQAYLEFSGWFSFYNYMNEKDTIVSLLHSAQSLYVQGSYQLNGYYNSIELNGHSFDKVYEMEHYDNIGHVKIYYSISIGIVGFRDRFGTLWHIDKIL